MADSNSRAVLPDDGVCGCCGRTSAVVALRDTVSANFTGWDELSRDADAVCLACAWAFTEPTVRTRPVLVDAGGAGLADWGQVAAVLASPLGPAQALTVPLRGRKHLLPTAPWGAVSSDGGVFTWWAREARLFVAVRDLTAAGVGEDVLLSGAVPTTAVAADPELLDAWSLVREWRGAPQLKVCAHVARRAGRPT